MDVRTAEASSLGQVREFAVNPAGPVSETVLSFSEIRFSVGLDSTATRVNAQGLIEVVPPNTPRFTHDPITLAPLGLLIEPEA